MRGVSEIHSPSHQQVNPSARNSTGISKLHSTAIPLSFLYDTAGVFSGFRRIGILTEKSLNLLVYAYFMLIPEFFLT